MNETNKEEKLLKYIGELAVQIENLKAENEKLKAKYDELNDFSNSQCAKLLKENKTTGDCGNVNR